VADFFCGSGTTAVVAAQTGRCFIAVDGAWRAVHTTYTRLVETGAAPFTLQVETQNTGVSETAGKAFTGQQQGEISLEQELLAGLDYWEVDPAWDGLVFRSAAQATRPRKKGQIRASITLPPEQIQPSALARLVKIDGSRTRHRIVR
jgi:hypothetical protein